jgi:hypothetical protein
MANTRNALKQPRRLKLILILAGVLLIFGWTLLLGATTWITDLPCVISPTSCTEGESLANALLYGPIIAGAIMLPAGLMYDLKIRREAKFFIVMVMAGALLFITLRLLAYVSISVHGL